LAERDANLPDGITGSRTRALRTDPYRWSGSRSRARPL
jgi:hypothetical protein